MAVRSLQVYKQNILFHSVFNVHSVLNVGKNFYFFILINKDSATNATILLTVKPEFLSVFLLIPAKKRNFKKFPQKKQLAPIYVNILKWIFIFGNKKERQITEDFSKQFRKIRYIKKTCKTNCSMPPSLKPSTVLNVS